MSRQLLNGCIMLHPLLICCCTFYSIRNSGNLYPICVGDLRVICGWSADDSWVICGWPNICLIILPCLLKLLQHVCLMPYFKAFCIIDTLQMPLIESFNIKIFIDAVVLTKFRLSQSFSNKISSVWMETMSYTKLWSYKL